MTEQNKQEVQEVQNQQTTTQQQVEQQPQKQTEVKQEVQQEKKSEKKEQKTAEKKRAKKEKDNFEMVVNFRRAFMGRRNVRARRALNMIRNSVKRHFDAERVIIDPILTRAVSTNGRDKIVRKVRINVRKVGEKIYLVTLALKSE